MEMTAREGEGERTNMIIEVGGGVEFITDITSFEPSS
jgi:3-dehydroquinate synthetase